MQTSQKRSKLALLASLFTVGILGGCATARPIPMGGQPLAQATAAGVVVSVPRLDSGDYPGDVLDVATAVVVVIENRSSSEIIIDPEGFLLGPAGGMQLAPIAPEQLALKEIEKPAGPTIDEGSMLAWGGRGGGGHISAPAPRVSAGGRVGGTMHVAPAYRGGAYGGRYYGGGRFYGGRYYGGGIGYNRGFNRWGFWAGGPLYWGPSWGATWYGSALFMPWFYDGPRYYAWSRADAARLALPAGRLPPGARTGGFLYYPRMENSRIPEGTPLVLQWTIREAAGQQPIGTVQLPLELRSE